VGGAAGVWLSYVQHTFRHAYWSRQDGWNAGRAAIAGSSYYDLPRTLHWLTGNIGYHHIHHLAPRIPNYYLRAAFESSPLLRRAPRLTLISSLKCAGPSSSNRLTIHAPRSGATFVTAQIPVGISRNVQHVGGR
jgi:acyl-lipid omega-6 desaturase (Delta-12 desaturase)